MRERESSVRWCAASFLLCLSLLTPVEAQEAATPSTGEAKIEASALGQRLLPLVLPWADGSFFPGVVVGVADGATTWMQGFGATVIGGDQIPNGRTLYEIGSLTKVVTGLLLADAHLRGVARLEDSLAQHLPAGTVVPLIDPERPIRLVHLSTHTSGLARLPSNLRPTDADPYATFDDEALYASLAASRPRSAPGDQYAYSNFGAGALGQVLARAEGLATFEQLCVARLCVTAALDDVRVTLDEERTARLAPPYDEALQAGTRWHFDALAGAGALCASTDDLLRFGRLFVEGAQHPHAAAARLAREVHARPQGGPPMGLGWHHVEPTGDRPGLVAHEGQTGGYHSVLLVAPSRGVVIVLLANAPTEVLGALAFELLRATLAGAGGTGNERGEEASETRRDANQPRPLVAMPPRAIVELPGRYQVGALDSVDITAEDGALFLKRSFRPRVRLHPVAEDRYEFRVVEGSIDVQRDGAGEVTGVVLLRAGDRATAERRAR